MQTSSESPLASVIIPSYNYAEYISWAIESVFEEGVSAEVPTEIPTEIIVIDDGSTDNTAQVVRRYEDRVRYIFQKNSGKAHATTRGIEAASGKYIFNLDADDYFLPNKIREVTNIFEADAEIVHVSHPAKLWLEANDTWETEQIPQGLTGRKIQGKDVLSYFYKRNILFGAGSTFAARAEVLKSLSAPVDVDMYIDEYLLLFTLDAGYCFFIEEPLSVWRIHGKNFSNLDTNTERQKEKNERVRKSRAAVLSAVLDSNLSDELKKLYILKNTVEQIAEKEALGKKSLGDVLAMWRFFFRNWRVFGRDTLMIISKHTLLNRTLPVLLLKSLRKGKAAFRRKADRII